MKFLYIGSFGSEDPTRAGLTFVMAKGAKEAGHDVEIALQGDAVVLCPSSDDLRQGGA